MTTTPVTIGKVSPQGSKTRIKDVHHQVKITLLFACAFAMLSALSTFINTPAGRWLPLHLFFTGTLLLAISGATQLFSVAWSAAQPPSQILVNIQRGSIIVGSLGLATSRALIWPSSLTAIFGTLLTLGIVFLIYLLHTIHKRAIQRRFRGVYFSYVIALSCGLLGTVFGSLLVEGHITSGYEQLRDAHLIINLWGLIGLIIGATLPSFVATQARMKMSKRATPNMHLYMTSLMLAGLVICVTGTSFSNPLSAVLGMSIYAGGIIGFIFLLPRVGKKQFKWAGPRMFMLLTGAAWWLLSSFILIIQLYQGSIITGTYVVPMLILGAYGQILIGSLAYFAPILTAKTPDMRTKNLQHTRAWPTYFAWNFLTISIVLSLPEIFVIASAIVVTVDIATRFILLVRSTKVVPDKPI